jgi:hypothetical protein
MQTLNPYPLLEALFGCKKRRIFGAPCPIGQWPDFSDAQKRKRKRMQTEDDGTWGGRTQNEEDEQPEFEASTMTLRTPAKKRNTQTLNCKRHQGKPAANGRK